MLNDCPILPFRIAEAYGGFAEVGGLARADARGLWLEFEVTALMGLYRSGVQNLYVPLADMASVELRRGWWSAKLVLRVGALAALRGLPGSCGGEATLRICRRDKAAAQSLVSVLRLQLSELELERAELRRADAAPPAARPPAVASLLLFERPPTESLNG